MSVLGSFEVDEASVVPIWIQIRRRLIYLIESGKFSEDQKLPSVRELSVDLGVNYNTINKVYQDLERDGYTHTKRGLGTFVSAGKQVEQDDAAGELGGMIAGFVSFAMSQGLTSEEIIEAVRRHVDACDE
ncbi:MAG: GntR family transcriptional regulator [Eggerthellaceae bacterium]|nr:GntR family transcriptional regulator [Eggerthellaceae bacterium]